MELLAMHTRCKPFVVNNKTSYVIHTYEIYSEYDFTNAETVIICKDVDTKREYMIILPYIQRDKNILFSAVKALIDTNAVQ